MPTNEQIINCKNKIKEKNEFYEEIIKSINEWEKTLLSKTNRIKQNLKDEINLLTKIVDNYNIYFSNFTYYNIFHSLDYYIKSKNNELLEKFKNSKNFDEKKDIIFEILNSNTKNLNNKHELKKWDLKSYYSIKNGIIEKINSTFYFEFLESEKTIYISQYAKNLDKIQYIFNSNFNHDIYSVTISKAKNQIYICLLDMKIVKIIDYDLTKKEFSNNENVIKDTNDILLHFNKCIMISNGFLATSDNKNIIIWSQPNDTSNNYNKIKKIHIYEKTSDLLLVNDEYFISSQPDINSITIIDIKSLYPEKYIPNIDCIDSLSFFYYLGII